MSRAIGFYLFLTGFYLSGCGKDGERSLGSDLHSSKSFPGYSVHPWGGPEFAIYFTNTRITDHRVTPPVVSHEYPPAMIGYNQHDGYNHLKITYTDGRAFDGTTGTATIELKGLGCLSNESKFPGNQVQRKALWMPCTNQNASGIFRQKQWFFIHVNPNGSTQILSNLEYALNTSNPQQECLEREGAAINLRPCNGIHNWQLIKH